MGTDPDFTSDREVKIGVRNIFILAGRSAPVPAVDRRQRKRGSFAWKLDNKVALPDHSVVAVLERFDPILLVPAARRQTISYAPAKAAQGFFLAWTVWPLLNLCETMGTASMRVRRRPADDAVWRCGSHSRHIHAGRLLDGNRMPELQRDFLLHSGQMRSPDQALKKRILHIKHWRCLVVPASPGWRSGLV